MKTKILLIAVLHFTVLVYSQKADTITYNLKTKNYYSTAAKKNVEKLANDTEYKIKVSNINPFYYKTTLKIKQDDKVKQVFELFKSVVRGTVPSALTDTIKEKNSSAIDFPTLYKKAVIIDASLKTSYYNIETLNDNDLEPLSQSNSLLSCYYELPELEQKQYASELAEIKRLNNVMNELVYFVKNENSEITLGKFKLMALIMN